jgi:hypothetical protein
MASANFSNDSTGSAESVFDHGHVCSPMKRRNACNVWSVTSTRLLGNVTSRIVENYLQKL